MRHWIDIAEGKEDKSPCWDGYEKKGMKTSKKTGKRVNNCVKEENDPIEEGLASDAANKVASMLFNKALDAIKDDDVSEATVNRARTEIKNLTGRDLNLPVDSRDVGKYVVAALMVLRKAKFGWGGIAVGAIQAALFLMVSKRK